MVRCIVPGCKNYECEKLKAKKKFFCFPRNKDLCALWVRVCMVGSDVDVKGIKICSDHFVDEDYRLKDILLNTEFVKRRLRVGAYPTQFVPDGNIFRVEDRIKEKERKEIVREAIWEYDRTYAPNAHTKDAVDQNGIQTECTSEVLEFHLQTDLTLLCRICMQKMTHAVAENIYSNEYSDETSLYSMLKAICAPVFSSEDIHEQQAKESFGMPKLICPTCRRKVVEAYKLHEMCVESDRKFWEMIMVQQELQDDGSDPLVEESVVQDAPNTKEVSIMIGSSDSEEDRDAPISNFEEIKVIRRSEKDKHVKSPGASNKTCELCSKVVGSVALLNKHMKDAHPSEVHDCKECELVFFSVSKLEDHKLFHKTGRAHACEVCKRRFKYMSGLRYHARIHMNYAPFMCDRCDKRFKTKGSLVQHLKLHSGVKPHRCEQCPLRFATKSDLKTHMYSHTKEKRFTCDICGSSFSMPDSLSKHKRVHTGVRPYSCTVCDLKFVFSSQLKNHMRTHTGERPYKCAYCPSAFAQTGVLAKHSRMHIGAKPFRCDRCESSFRLLGELRDHYKVHYEGGSKSESDETQSQIGKDNDFRFTTVSVLNRGYELAKQRSKKDDEQEEQ